MADAFQRIPNDFARDINAAVATGDADAIVSTVQHGKESGAFGVRPTPALLDALGSVDVTPLSETDRRLVRECRLFTAQVLGSTNIAGMEAEALMREESDRLDDGQKAELEMTIAFAEIKKGHRETALHMWRRLLRSPAVLGAEGRGWAWRNIAITLPDDNAEKRHAAKCSADAFLESGQKDEASKSLMLLANSLLHVEPSSAISTIDEIVALIDQNNLQNRGLRAATYHARGNRLAQLGRHSEATADALKAVELWRGLIGAEESLISSLHLAAIESEVVGDTSAADAFRLEADTLTREVNAPDFTLAQRVEELAESFDQKRASDLLQDAQKLRNGEVVTAVRVIQAMQDATLSDCGRLSLLEDALQKLDSEGAQEGTKEPARIALATSLFKLDQAERAEVWCRKILTANPFSRFARDALVQSLWRREQWGDAAIFLKKQIQLMGSMPGLLYAYGRSLFEAGDFSGAVTALTQSLDASDENADVGDVDGHRWTYEFRDSEGLDRTMVVDIGLGVSRTDDAEMLHVTQFMRFVSLDGIDWHDPQKDEKLHIGNAVLDFIAKTRSGPDQLQPVKKDTVPRVVGSSALKMHDHNLIVLPRAVADEGTPIIINNACVSWHRLAKNLIFGNARAYIGTLFPVTPTEAQEVIIELLDKHYGKPLPAALWSAQREVYGDSPRRPYIATGVYPQRLQVKRQDIVGGMVSRLSGTLAAWNKNLAGVDPNDGPRLKIVQETIAYYEHQLAHFRELAKS